MPNTYNSVSPSYDEEIVNFMMNKTFSFSLYQTYKDMGSYSEALDYYEKEYELIKDVPKEAYTTLYNIAEALFMAKKPYSQVEKACLDARKAVSSYLSLRT